MVSPSSGSNTGSPRKAIPKRVRFEVLRRDNYTCRYCRSTENALTLDHVVPNVLGGSDTPDNLVAACRDCNAGKSSSSPDAALVAEVSDDAVRWAAAMKQAADRMGIADEAMESRLVGLAEYWHAAIPRYNHGKPKWRLPSDWRAVIVRLLDAGLPDAVVFDCIDIAVNSRGNVDNAFRYMLGVANNKLSKLQDEAREILAETDQPAPKPDIYWDGYSAGVERWSRSCASHQYYAVSKIVDAEGWAWRAAV